MASDNDLKPYTVLHSKYISREPWFTVRQERVQLANGHVIPKYWVQEFPAWINVIARTQDHRYVFVRQYRHGLGRVDYELCAGVVEESDANPLEAAKRELLEETGYGGGDWKAWMRVCANPATQNNWTYSFFADGVQRVAEPSLDAGEEISVRLFTFAEVEALLRENGIAQALHAAALWKLIAEKANGG